MLSGPQRKFAEGVASGLSAMAAYRAAYPGAKENSVNANAARLIGKDGIKSEIERLRKMAEGPILLTLERKLGFLSYVVLEGDCKMQDRLRALDLHAKLSGEMNERLQVSGDVKVKVTIGGT
jgi:hypothetical protein